MSAVLNGKIREQTGRAATRELRRNKEIPAVLYGLKDHLSFSIRPKDLSEVLGRQGRNVLIDLHLKGDKERKVILKEYQSHPLKDQWVHADFLEVDLNKAVKVSVPVKLMGQSPGEKMGGIVNQVIKRMEVECLPSAIPESFEVDMSGVELGQVVHVSDMNFPEHVKVLHRPTEAVVSVYLEKIKEEEKPAEGEEEAAEGEPKAEGAEEETASRDEPTQKES